MTQGKSLVEDMARAIFGDDVQWARIPPDYRDPFLRQATAALSVLKDRLPADDRELVERLTAYDHSRPMTVPSARGTRTVYPLINPDGHEAADRIIAYSASRDATE